MIYLDLLTSFVHNAVKSAGELNNRRRKLSRLAGITEHVDFDESNLTFRCLTTSHGHQWCKIYSATMFYIGRVAQREPYLNDGVHVNINYVTHAIA